MPLLRPALLPTVICAGMACGASVSETSANVCADAPSALPEEVVQKLGHALLQLELPGTLDAKTGQHMQQQQRRWFGHQLLLSSQLPQSLPSASGSLLGNSPGARVSISEEGFEEIKKLNCRKEMSEFARRTVADMGLEICQEGGLQGTVGYYFQASSKKTFDDLKMDIKAGSASECPWVGKEGYCPPLAPTCPSIEDRGASHRRRSCAGPPSTSSVGSTSALDSSGFDEVKKLYCRLDMESFIRRTVDDMDLEVCHEGGLQGLVSFYVENDVSHKTFEDLKKDIEMGAQGQCPWLGKDGNCPPMPESCGGTAGTLSMLAKQLSQGPSGSRAVLSTKGFEKIKNLSSREDMEEFARRTVIDLGYEVCHQGGLEDAVEDYFTVYSNKTFVDLKSQIEADLHGECPWVAKDGDCPPPSQGCHNVPERRATSHRRRSCLGPPNWDTMAAYANLSHSAFEEIKEMHCQVEMNLFTRRLVKFMGYNICHEGGLLHLVSLYVNTNVSTWTFDNFKADIKNGTKGECPWLTADKICLPMPGCANAFRESHRRRSCMGRKD